MTPTRPSRRRMLALLAAPLGGLPRPSAAYWVPGTQAPDAPSDPRDPYQATAIVTGVDMRSRPAGFARCLRDVLIKVSGEPRLRGDPRLSDLLAHADRLVASFDYVDQMAGIPPHDDQGTYDRPYDLTVHFDPVKIDKALTQLGERPWRGARPVIVPAIAVRGVKERYLLSAESPLAADQRASLAEAAGQYGLRLRVPMEAELATWNVRAGDAPATFPQAASSNEAIVGGTLEFDEFAPGWTGSWRMRWQGSDYAWRIVGVNFDEAFRDIARGVLRLASGHGTPT